MAEQGYARPDLLVETEWLAEHFDDPHVRVVDCDPFEVYARAHIKGAVGIRVHHYLKQPEYIQDNKRHPFVAPPATIKEVMEGMGIGDDTLVIAYDDHGSNWAARLWWVLNYYGHTNARVLNGGWRKWFAESRPVTLDIPAPRRVTFTPRAEPDLLCTLDYGMQHLNDPDLLFLDVRSDGEWEGTNARGNKRVGHIPGAVHLEWLNFIEDNDFQTFKSADELHRLLDRAGVRPDQEVVTY